MDKSIQSIQSIQSKGRMSASDHKTIAELSDKLTYTEIAQQLGRNPETIRKYIEKNFGKKLVAGGRGSDPTYDIKKSIIWRELETEFSEDELKLFLYHWQRIINQFKDDVFPTEEIQVVDTIKIEILQSRILKHQRDCAKEIEKLQEEINKEEALGEGVKNESRITALMQMQAAHRSAQVNLSKEYSEFQNRKGGMLKEMKATRSERIKNIENSKQSLIGWISEIMRNQSLRKELGLRMEKFRISVDLEKIKMMEQHRYIDGTDDCPLLSEDTWKYQEEKETKECKKSQSLLELPVNQEVI